MTRNHWKTCFISKEPSSEKAPASESALSWNAVMVHGLTSAFRDNSRRAKWNLTLGLTSSLATSAKHLPAPPCPGDAGCAESPVWAPLLVPLQKHTLPLAFSSSASDGCRTIAWEHETQKLNTFGSGSVFPNASHARKTSDFHPEHLPLALLLFLYKDPFLKHTRILKGTFDDC